jgi:hypothetical protein
LASRRCDASRTIASACSVCADSWPDLVFELCRLLKGGAAGIAQAFGHAPGAVLGVGKVGEQDTNVSTRGFCRTVQRFAMFGQYPDPSFSCAVMEPSRLAAWSPSPIRSPAMTPSER